MADPTSGGRRVECSSTLGVDKDRADLGRYQISRDAGTKSTMDFSAGTKSIVPALTMDLAYKVTL